MKYPKRIYYTEADKSLMWDHWQRGSNEQINGLLRQYFPKGMDLSGIHQNRLNAVARRFNERPRETLDFETPAERFEQCVASTG